MDKVISKRPEASFRLNLHFQSIEQLFTNVNIENVSRAVRETSEFQLGKVGETFASEIVYKNFIFIGFQLMFELNFLITVGLERNSKYFYFLMCVALHMEIVLYNKYNISSNSNIS